MPNRGCLLNGFDLKSAIKLLRRLLCVFYNNAYDLLLPILIGWSQFYNNYARLCGPVLNCRALIFTQTILVPNFKPFPIGNHMSHIWVSFSAALPQAKLMDRGYGKLLMHRFVIIIVLLKLELEAPRQRESFRIQIRVWDWALKLGPVFGCYIWKNLMSLCIFCRQWLLMSYKLELARWA